VPAGIQPVDGAEKLNCPDSNRLNVSTYAHDRNRTDFDTDAELKPFLATPQLDDSYQLDGIRDASPAMTTQHLSDPSRVPT
jgi:hypothetical protein